MPAHYGYFKGSEASDGDRVDFYMGPNPDSQHAYVIDQVDAETGAYDEAKEMRLGRPRRPRGGLL